jgi:ADP-ribose pyrophosphatase YjhB (NUDIX family)
MPSDQHDDPPEEPSPVRRIGRRPDNDIIVNDLGVSKQHAELRRTPAGRYWIIDSGSHLGTFVNGTRVTQQELEEGDIIAIGHATFRLAGGELIDYVDDGRASDELTVTQAPSEADPLPQRRIDYYDDPRAPQASSLVPAVNVVVTNQASDILMIRRTDNGNWALPGGAVDLGESVSQAAVRETREETGIRCAITGVTGIYSDPRHVILYTSNGEVRQEFSIVLTARPLAGQPTPSSESSEVRWVPASEVAGYTMDRSMRIRINDYLGRNDSPVIT